MKTSLSTLVLALASAALLPLGNASAQSPDPDASLPPLLIHLSHLNKAAESLRDSFIRAHGLDKSIAYNWNGRCESDPRFQGYQSCSYYFWTRDGYACGAYPDDSATQVPAYAVLHCANGKSGMVINLQQE